MDLIGFDDDEMRDILGDEVEGGLTPDDEVPDPPKKDITKPDDLWILWDHRLVCGDATKARIIMFLIKTGRPSMLLTDPPYGMNLNTDFSSMVRIGKGKKYESVVGDDTPYNPSHLFRDFPGIREFILFGADYYAERIPDRNKGSWFVWDKAEGGISPNDDYDKMSGSNFELAWSRVRHKRALIRVLWKGIFGLSIEDVKSRLHPTQKPTKVMRWFMEWFTQSGELIVDPFLGSGTTVIAAEKLERRCYGLEIEPRYCDVIVERWENFTGKKAKHVKAK